MKHVLLALLVSASIFLSGCASIVSDSKYRTTFNSSPQGATVTITNENGVDVYRGTTPFSTTLDASDGYFDAMEYTARFALTCYESKAISLKTTMDPWYLGNILFGGVIGMLIVDPATGAMWQLKQNYSVALSPKETQSCRQTRLQALLMRSLFYQGGIT